MNGQRLTQAEKESLIWLRGRGGDGVLIRGGYVLAQGEVSHHSSKVFYALEAKRWVRFYTDDGGATRVGCSDFAPTPSPTLPLSLHETSALADMVQLSPSDRELELGRRAKFAAALTIAQLAVQDIAKCHKAHALATLEQAHAMVEEIEEFPDTLESNEDLL